MATISQHTFSGIHFIQEDEMFILLTDSLEFSPCTFENNHRSCGFTTDADGQSCNLQYTWRRGGGALDDIPNRRIHVDHTYGNDSGKCIKHSQLSLFRTLIYHSIP